MKSFGLLAMQHTKLYDTEMWTRSQIYKVYKDHTFIHIPKLTPKWSVYKLLFWKGRRDIWYTYNNPYLLAQEPSSVTLCTWSFWLGQQAQLTFCQSLQPLAMFWWNGIPGKETKGHIRNAWKNSYWILRLHRHCWWGGGAIPHLNLKFFPYGDYKQASGTCLAWGENTGATLKSYFGHSMFTKQEKG